jgi:hypothetical protein
MMRREATGLASARRAVPSGCLLRKVSRLGFVAGHPAGASKCDAHRKFYIESSLTTSTCPIQVGKYLVSPLTREVGHNRYAASVSIRSGQGRATHDRVLRLLPVFADAPSASRYATEQGLAWVRDPIRYMQTGLLGQGI